MSLCAQLLGLSHNNYFLKKRLWIAALKCVHNRLAAYSKFESAVVVDEHVSFSFIRPWWGAFQRVSGPPQRTMGPLYLNDICWCHCFREATAALRLLWHKAAESFVCAAVIQLPPIQPNSLKFNANILIEFSPAFCVSLLGGKCTAVDLQWLLSCLTTGVVVVRNTTCPRWKLLVQSWSRTVNAKKACNY